MRLAQGDFGRETVYGTEPVERAKAFEAAGARWVHVVDLDAVRSGVATNRPVIADIAAAVGIAVQAGGGVRRADDVAGLLDAGVARVIVGTAAVTQEGFLADVAQRWPGRVGAAVDHFNGEVRVRGWAEGFGRDVATVVQNLAAAGAVVVMATEISRDGLMVGPDLRRLPVVAEEVRGAADCFGRDVGTAGRHPSAGLAARGWTAPGGGHSRQSDLRGPFYGARGGGGARGGVPV